MRHPLVRTLIAGAAVLAVAVVGAPAVSADPGEGVATGCESAADQHTVYLKGSGNNFNPAGWTNTFKVGFESYGGYDQYIAQGNTASVIHLVYSGQQFDKIGSMQLTFTNGQVFTWTPGMGPSVNGGGNNEGWVVFVPYDWTVSYIDRGNNNESGSCLVTGEFSNNPQFNITGYTRGTPAPVGALAVTASGTETQRQPMMHREWDQSCTVTTTETYGVQWKKDGAPISGTLVSRLGYIVDNDPKTVDTIDPSSGGLVLGKNGKVNGFTYVNVDIAAASQPGGYDVEIADSSFNANGKKNSDAYNRPTGYKYNVSIHDGKLWITFDSHITTSVAVHIADNPAALPNNPGAHSANGASVPMVADANGDGHVAVFVHMDGLTWTSELGYTLVGYVLLSSVVGDEVCVDAETYTDTAIADGEPLVTPLSTGDFTITVTDSDGNPVTNLTALAPGTYTVTVSFGGDVVDTKDVLVEAGKTTHADFTDLEVTGPDLPVQYDADGHNGTKTVTAVTVDNKADLSLLDPFAVGAIRLP